MRLVDADGLMEHVWRDKLDTREMIAQMIASAPTIKEIPTKIPIHIFERLLELAENQKRKKSDEILNMILDEIMDTGAYEREVRGKTDFLSGINYCIGVIEKYKERK